MVLAKGRREQIVVGQPPRWSEESECAYVLHGLKIIADIRAGLTREPALTEVDREIAITQTLRLAQPNDVVLIAGKGHEDYQEIGASRLPFSDVAVARAGLLAREQFHHA